MVLVGEPGDVRPTVGAEEGERGHEAPQSLILAELGDLDEELGGEHVRALLGGRDERALVADREGERWGHLDLHHAVDADGLSQGTERDLVGDPGPLEVEP